MPSPQHESIVEMLRGQVLPNELPSPQDLRALFEAMASAFPLPAGARSKVGPPGLEPGTSRL